MYASRPLLFTSHVSSQRSPVEVVFDKTTQHSFFMLESYSTNSMCLGRLVIALNVLQSQQSTRSLLCL